MECIAYKSDNFQLSYRADLGIGIARWLLEVGESVLHTHYEKMLEVAVAQSCRCWLLDLRRRELNFSVSTGWLLHDFFPHLREALGTPGRVAYVVSPYRLGTVGETTEEVERRFFTLDCQILVTETEKEAYHWLGVGV
jgi:hypothetical protein